MLVSEILKRRTNRGETRGMSFYRDRNGTEVDLVIESPSRITLVEAKSSGTASKKLFNATRRVHRHLAKSSVPCDEMVVYGGDQLQNRSEGILIPWHKLHEAEL